MREKETQALSPDAIAFSRAVNPEEAAGESRRLLDDRNMMNVLVAVFDTCRKTTDRRLCEAHA